MVAKVLLRHKINLNFIFIALSRPFNGMFCEFCHFILSNFLFRLKVTKSKMFYFAFANLKVFFYCHQSFEIFKDETDVIFFLVTKPFSIRTSFIIQILS